MIRLAFLALLISSQAFSAPSRLDKIRDTQTLTIGYLGDDIPFSYLNSQKELIGFGVDLSHYLAESMAKALNVKEITIRPQQITLENRFDAVNQGLIDISCASHSNTPSRQKIVNFSHNYFVARGRLLTRNDSGIKNYKALADKKVGALANSSAFDSLSRKSNQFKFAEVLELHSREQAIEMLDRGELDGFADDDVLINSLIASMGKSDQYQFIGQALTVDHYACILPHGDQAFKELVDSQMGILFFDKEIHKIFERWFLSPIDMSNGDKITLNFPLNDSLEKMYSFPDDNPIGD